MGYDPYGTGFRLMSQVKSRMSPLSSHYCCSLLKHLCEARSYIGTQKLHCHILKSILKPETFLLNTLVSTYIKLGSLGYACNVFDQIPEPNVFSWNTILSGYWKIGNISGMQVIFNRMPKRNEVSWNLLISGYADKGLSFEAVKCYNLMVKDGPSNLNRITLSRMIILSSNHGRVCLGRQIHGHVLKFGFLSYVFVGSPLVDMYSKAGLIFDARLVFNELPEKNVVVNNTMMMGLLRCRMVEDARQLFCHMQERDSVSWTTVVAGLTQNGLEKEAIDLFREMSSENLKIDQYTFGSVLTACGGLLALREGRQIHAYIIRTNYEDNVFVGSSVVDMYCKCRNIKSAETVFNRMACKNVVSWTAMLVGYGQNGYSEEAMKIFCSMQRHGIEPDEFTLGSVISSCANLASLEEGAQFHGKALVSGLISFITVSNALITLYGKCGSIDDSGKLFTEMSFKDAVSWTALVSVYSQFGKAMDTLILFDQMLENDLRPDQITFIAVLSACSRAGLVEKGYHIFNSMIQDHGIKPLPDHYTCMIDLLSRSGRLEEAREFIIKMPSAPDAICWATLLSCCRFFRNMEIGKWAGESLLQLEPHNPVGYVLLANIYAAKGKWNEVSQLRKRMKDQGLKKEPGCTWIKYENRVYIFSSDDKSNPYLNQIYSMLEKLNCEMIKEGYVPDTSSVLHDVEDSEKVKMLRHHSERLAIAFGLIFLPPGVPIRLVKNLRVCVDCHNATKYISKITKREILVRDGVRFHLFKEGSCSCGDFW